MTLKVALTQTEEHKTAQGHLRTAVAHRDWWRQQAEGQKETVLGRLGLRKPLLHVCPATGLEMAAKDGLREAEKVVAAAAQAVQGLAKDSVVVAKARKIMGAHNQEIEQAKLKIPKLQTAYRDSKTDLQKVPEQERGRDTDLGL